MKIKDHLAAKIVLSTIVITIFTGCASLREKAPQAPPPPLKPDTIIKALRTKSTDITTFTDARAKISIKQVEKESSKIHRTGFGAVLAVDRSLPGVWLRAEKLGQKIFGLRAKGENFWLELADTEEVITGSGPAYRRLPYLIKPSDAALWLANPDQLGLTWDTTKMEVHDRFYVFNVKSTGLPLRSIYVHRDSLNIKKIIAWNVLGEKTQKIELSEYKSHDGTLYPSKVSIHRPEYQSTVMIEFKRPRFNNPLPAQTFRPRAREGWHHVNLDYEPISNIKAFSKYQ